MSKSTSKGLKRGGDQRSFSNEVELGVQYSFANEVESQDESSLPKELSHAPLERVPLSCHVKTDLTRVLMLLPTVATISLFPTTTRPVISLPLPGP